MEDPISAPLCEKGFFNNGVFITNVDYFQMSRKISPIFLAERVNELIQCLRNILQALEEISKPA
jgi:hypothetical protein